MDWVIRTLGTSIGKKQLMAVTGLGFIGFLVGHLIGNLTIYFGADAFNSYAKHLHELDPLVRVAEMGLVTMAVIHVSMATLLVFQNWKARPVRYACKKGAGGRTLFSRTMPYTGALILVFVIIHLLNFHFVDHENQTIWQIVSGVLCSPGYVLFYIFSVVVVAFHVKHGLWSAFQTLGASHVKYMPAVFGVSVVFALAVGLGFGFLPVIIKLAGA